MNYVESNILFPGIISTKLHPPAVRARIIRRQRLFDKINSSRSKLILLAAPAGFGKSTLVLDWLKENGGTSAWLSLEESDNEIRRFYQYFLSALHISGVPFDDDLIGALKGSTIPPAGTIVFRFINDLYAFGKPVTIVLDDYYFIEDREIHKVVNSLLDHLPANVRLVISTRVDPLLPLHRMRARNELTEIRQRDLRFTYEEACEFFKSTVSVQLSQNDVEKLAVRTEGWIAGLQLAAVSLQDSQDVRKFIDSFTGTNRYVLDYLLEEVLNRQTKEVQMFLLQTSILRRFNEDICNTITAGMNARKILEHLERSNLFLIPLDDTGEWFRYHHLFSELLQFRLKQLYPKLVDELHHYASVWYEVRNNISEAIEYALRVKNYERAAFLLDRYGVQFISRSELPMLINYERKIPRELVEKFPRLLVSRAWALMLMHKTNDIEATLQLVERLIVEKKESFSEKEIAEAHGHIRTITAFVMRLQGRLSESLEESKHVLDNLPYGNRLICGLLKFNIGRIYMKQGYAAKAITTLEEAFDDNFDAGNFYVSLAILGHIGYLHSITEKISAACGKLEDALNFAEKYKIASLPAAGYIYYQYGRVLYHRNDLDEALRMLTRAVQLGELGNEPDIVCNALFHLSCVYAVNGDKKNALESFAHAEEIERNTSLAVYEADIINERIVLAYLLNEQDIIETWMKEAEPSISGDFTIVEEARLILIIRGFLENADYNGALKLIRMLAEECEKRGRNHTLLQLDILEAVALYGLSKKNAAWQKLNRGLEKASQMGYKRVLINFGEHVKSLLQAAVNENTISITSRNFACELLPLYPGTPASTHRNIPKYKQQLIDPLTEREQEVLFYISQDLSNKEIAVKLFVSLDTVKTHLKNIYAKLQVNSRKDAVTRANELKLLR